MHTLSPRMIRGLLACLTRLVPLQFKNRFDEGRDAVRQARMESHISDIVFLPASA